ncbi:hypothetical protein FACS189451_08810 [Bacteroidia bacterium]|nr:hypothetical protein FACS189451_08810 [Bacteroidia bacterium]
MNDKERILDGMTKKQIIVRCGELQLPHEQVVLLVAEQHPVSQQQLLANLQTTGTNEYEWYQSGVAEGNLKLNIELEANVSDPKAKDAYKHLSAERRRQAVNRKLDDLFNI